MQMHSEMYYCIIILYNRQYDKTSEIKGKLIDYYEKQICGHSCVRVIYAAFRQINDKGIYTKER